MNEGVRFIWLMPTDGLDRRLLPNCRTFENARNVYFCANSFPKERCACAKTGLRIVDFEMVSETVSQSLDTERGRFLDSNWIRNSQTSDERLGRGSGTG